MSTTEAGNIERIKPAALPNGWMDYSAYQQQRYMPALDGLRGIAIALVIPVHLHDQMWNFVSGSAGATIFFVLSGYLITRLALREESNSGRLNTTAFYIRRGFRILPLYCVVLAIYALLILGLQLWQAKTAPFRAALPYYLSFFQEIPLWSSRAALSGELPFYHSWSLGIEEKFYLIWPMLMMGTARKSTGVRLGVVIIGAALCIFQGVTSENRPGYHLETYGFILLGASLALFLSLAEFYRIFVRFARWVWPLSVLISVATLFDIVPHTHLRAASTLCAVSVTGLVGVLVSSRSMASRVLSAPGLVLAGRISYGIFLVHILCLSAVEKVAEPGHGVAVGLFAYAGTFFLAAAIAYVAHITFEKPMIQLGRRLFPNGEIRKDKIGPLIKSLIAVKRADSI